jgi:hypothetical protein
VVPHRSETHPHYETSVLKNDPLKLLRLSSKHKKRKGELPKKSFKGGRKKKGAKNTQLPILSVQRLNLERRTVLSLRTNTHAYGRVISQRLQ